MLTQSDSGKVVVDGNTGTSTRSRNWSFTWNNYTENSLTHLTQYFGTDKHVIGKEVGAEGTPHLQGNVIFKSQRTFQSLHNKFPLVHWEITRNPKAAMDYCKKDGDFTTNIEPSLEEQYDKFMEEEYKSVEWKDWQKKCIELVEGKPNKRTVHWYWEKDGGRGKTYLGKWLEWKYPTVIANGKQNDVFNGVKSFLELREKYPKIVIVDIPRTNQGYVCYSTMEKLKDGLFYSGKYEGGVIRLLPLHVLVFANFEPDTNMMSKDRWDIVEIEKKRENSDLSAMTSSLQ